MMLGGFLIPLYVHSYLFPHKENRLLIFIKAGEKFLGY